MSLIRVLWHCKLGELWGSRDESMLRLWVDHSGGFLQFTAELIKQFKETLRILAAPQSPVFEFFFFLSVRGWKWSSKFWGKTFEAEKHHLFSRQRRRNGQEKIKYSYNFKLFAMCRVHTGGFKGCVGLSLGPLQNLTILCQNGIVQWVHHYSWATINFHITLGH